MSPPNDRFPFSLFDDSRHHLPGFSTPKPPVAQAPAKPATETETEQARLESPTETVPAVDEPETSTPALDSDTSARFEETDEAFDARMTAEDGATGPVDADSPAVDVEEKAPSKPQDADWDDPAFDLDDVTPEDVKAIPARPNDAKRAPARRDEDAAQFDALALAAAVAVKGKRGKRPLATVHAIPRSDKRPVIQLSVDLADNVDSSIVAMRSDDCVYQKDGRLVRVVRVTEEEAEADKSVTADTPQIRPMIQATLCERLTRAAVFTRFEARSGNWKDALPTDLIIQALLARVEYPGIRALIGVIESPSIRPDGSIIQAPGYDRATKYLYAPSAEFPAVPESPTKEDAAKALAELSEPFADFPFTNEASRASAIAALLTIIARPAITGSTPAFLFDANVRGSGKTLLADVVSMIATGRATAKMTYPKDDVELEKVLGSYALRAAATISFDNITSRFGGGPLDRCLTAGDLVELRILGKSEIPTLKWLTVIMGTGNNIDVQGDTSRRTIFSRLESPLENPEERQVFAHHPLQDWVMANRPRLAVAALTIMRAWFVAGRPRSGCRSWGSFEAWSAMVPPAIVFAGGADPMLTRPAASGEEEDLDKRALIAILDGLPRLDVAGAGLTAKAIIDALYSRRERGDPPDGHDNLRDAIEALTSPVAGKPPTAQKFGYAMRHLRKRVVGGRFLECKLDRTGIARWHAVGHGQGKGAGDAWHAGDVSNPTPARWQNDPVIDAANAGAGDQKIPSNPQHPQQTGFGYPTAWDAEDGSSTEELGR